MKNFRGVVLFLVGFSKSSHAGVVSFSEVAAERIFELIKDKAEMKSMQIEKMDGKGKFDYTTFDLKIAYIPEIATGGKISCILEGKHLSAPKTLKESNAISCHIEAQTLYTTIGKKSKSIHFYGQVAKVLFELMSPANPEEKLAFNTHRVSTKVLGKGEGDQVKCGYIIPKDRVENSSDYFCTVAW